MKRRNFVAGLGIPVGALLTANAIGATKQVQPSEGQSLRVVQTIEDLAGISSPGGVVMVLGYHKPNGSGGGTFYWDASDQSPPDAGGTIASRQAPALGRWKRVQ